MQISYNLCIIIGTFSENLLYSFRIRILKEIYGKIIIIITAGKKMDVKDRSVVIMNKNAFAPTPPMGWNS